MSDLHAVVASLDKKQYCKERDQENVLGKPTLVCNPKMECRPTCSPHIDIKFTRYNIKHKVA